MSKRKAKEDDHPKDGEKRLRTSSKEMKISGLQLVEKFISPKEHHDLIKFIDSQSWSTVLKRRVQQYGFAYNYSSTYTKPEATTAIPSEFNFLIDKIMEQGLFSQRPDQIIVNEYLPGQGILSHTDHVKHFGDTVASLSLGSNCIMNFELGSNQHEILLPIQSLLVLTGDARYKWKHGIIKRKKDTIDGKRIARKRRVSITFRFLLDKEVPLKQESVIETKQPLVPVEEKKC